MGKLLRKTTQQDFELFKQEFGFWQKELGCNEYEVAFEFVRLTDAASQIVEVKADRFLVSLAKAIPKEHFKFHNGIKYLAKHEAIHMLLYKITRFIPSEIENTPAFLLAEEYLVTILEKLIPDPRNK